MLSSCSLSSEYFELHIELFTLITNGSSAVSTCSSVFSSPISKQKLLSLAFLDKLVS